MKKITVLGGGTGTFVVLSGLKHYDVDLGAVVTMTDSGGSTGKLRVQLGVLPPGDLRQCFVALSEAPDLWRKLFLYRFENGDFAGHNFGNIFMSALEKVSTNYDEVLKTVGFVLKSKGHVIPVTYETTHLCVQYENGTVLKGEGYIDENLHEKSRIVRAFLEPVVNAHETAIQRIRESDSVVIGPGDLYTSIIPVLLPEGMKQALKETSAKLIYVVNLMTKSGQTVNYSAHDHVADLESYLGRKIDIIISHDGPIEERIIDWYEDHHEHPVHDDLGTDARVVRASVADNTTVEKSKSDTLTRSILRHDSKKLAAILMKVA
jgi:uncharacterized cofD-like protein